MIFTYRLYVLSFIYFYLFYDAFVVISSYGKPIEFLFMLLSIVSARGKPL